MIEELQRCPICSTSDIEEISYLKSYPLTELFESKSEHKYYPLTHHDQSFLYCNECDHGFLRYQISPKYLYLADNYHTSTSNSGGSKLCIDNFAKFINAKSSTKTYTLDIGGNDSILLKKIFCQAGMVIDPNAKDIDSGFDICNGFIEDLDIGFLANKKSLTIVSSHTLEHIKQPHLFFEIMSKLNNINDIFLQFPSLELMIDAFRFDLVHHQHLHYYSLTSIKRLASHYGYFVNSYEFDYSHYGTLRVHLTKNREEIYNQLTKNFLPSHEIIERFSSFRSHCIASAEILEKFGSIYCYGASLMLPIAFYYHPSLKDSLGIFDMDKSKTELRYVGINVPVIRDNNEDLSSLNLCVTAVATRKAHRAIMNQLINRDVQNIFSPFLFF